MKNMMLKGYCWVKRLMITGMDDRDERGATMVEYAVIVAGVATAAAVGASALGAALNTYFGTTIPALF